MSHRLFALRVPTGGTGVSPPTHIGFAGVRITLVAVETSAVTSASEMSQRRGSMSDAAPSNTVADVADEASLVAEYPVSTWKDSQGRVQRKTARVVVATLSSSKRQQKVDFYVSFNYDEDTKFHAIGGQPLGLTGYYERVA